MTATELWPEAAAPYDLQAEIALFVAMHDRLGYALRIAKIGDLRDLEALGADIRDCLGLLRTLHDIARAEIAEDSAESERGRPPFPSRETINAMMDEQLTELMQARLASGPPAEDRLRWVEEKIAAQTAGRLPTGHFAVTRKMAFFLIRAYQDALCRVLLLATDNPVGSRTSLNKHFGRALSPVRAIVDEEFPEYRLWFDRWKGLRDRIKYGAEFGLSQVGGNVGVAFIGIEAAPEERVGLSQFLTVFLRDIGDGLKHTRQLADVA